MQPQRARTSSRFICSELLVALQQSSQIMQMQLLLRADDAALIARMQSIMHCA